MQTKANGKDKAAKGGKGGGKAGGGKQGKGHRKKGGDGKGPDLNNSSSELCKCCGALGHSRKMCWFKDKACSNCQKLGHLAKICWAEEWTPEPALKDNENKDDKTMTDDKADKQWPCSECYQWNSIKVKMCKKKGCKGKAPENFADTADEPGPKSGISTNTQRMIERMEPAKLKKEIEELEDKVSECDRQIKFYGEEKNRLWDPLVRHHSHREDESGICQGVGGTKEASERDAGGEEPGRRSYKGAHQPYEQDEEDERRPQDTRGQAEEPRGEAGRRKRRGGETAPQRACENRRRIRGAEKKMQATRSRS